MKKLVCTALLMFSALFVFGQSAIGTWLSFDEDSGEVNSHLTITEKDGVLYCHISKLFNPDSDVCTKCKGDKKNKPLLGLEIMWGMTKKGENEWSGGKIMDAENGKTYKARLKLEDANTLNVRGYLGNPMFGRSVTWKRLDE